ncbi:MAG: hypothetical protein JWM99_3199, partial [Verrucomicrobiales bacterium]|nr:hypothetical protein [Verrucomicrobiales bacterium]
EMWAEVRVQIQGEPGIKKIVRWEQEARWLFVDVVALQIKQAAQVGPEKARRRLEM